MNNLMYII